MKKLALMLGLAFSPMAMSAEIVQENGIEWVKYGSKDLAQLTDQERQYIEDAIGVEALEVALDMLDTHDVSIKIEMTKQFTFFSEEGGESASESEGRLCEITVERSSGGQGGASVDGKVVGGSIGGSGGTYSKITMKVRCKDALQALKIVNEDQ